MIVLKLSLGYLTEVISIIAGLCMYLIAYTLLINKEISRRIGKALFWGVVGTICIFRRWMPHTVVDAANILLVLYVVANYGFDRKIKSKYKGEEGVAE